MVKGEQRGLQIERLQAFFMFSPFLLLVAYSSAKFAHLDSLHAYAWDVP